MEDLFGQIECRSKSDSTVMRILRSAMDKAHEKLQSKDGPIEFLLERSTFYELAAILVEGGLNIVQEETDTLEGNTCDKILSDLMEIKNWLQGRIQDMKTLIIEKDRELTESTENESKLREELEIKERELAFLHEKLEPGQLKNEDFRKLKNSVDLQVWNIKQKLEDEKKSLNTETRKRKSRLSSPNLSFDFLENEKSGNSFLTEGIERFSFLKSKSELSGPDKNLIRRMSSDIDILKETLDVAFGRMHSAEVLPLEKQWMWSIERDIESVLVKGFVSNLEEHFDVELKKEVGLLEDNCLLKEDIYMVFLREISKASELEKDAFALESLVQKDVYQFVIIQAVKDFQAHFQESEALKQLDFQERTKSLWDSDNLEEDTFRGEESLIQKLDSMLKCVEAEEDLMLKASSEIKEHSANNSLVISNCEEMDERRTIEWLINDDESMFNSVSEKLERALQQLYTSKELLAELGQSLEEVSEDVELNNVPIIEDEKKQLLFGEEDNRVLRGVQSDHVLAKIMHFEQVVGNVEKLVHENLESKSLRLEILKRRVDTLTEPVASMRTRKLLYKNAFISRSRNLKLAEIEVDLLGDQVEALLCLLERIYVELNRNASVLSRYFEVILWLTCGNTGNS
ncbi:hypothetical protein BUALT_Bualt01G0105100 [Buddleja alternifolia]|uniref:WPP domain-associated protein n=1 Tax=Buddleja alternifolia TaxID=168488 RepID=A0AAV6Y6Z2_9LAMI|nr:hypothetical protein BUALT_Bualt01G0105100 [Buddleja alternifolia]